MNSCTCKIVEGDFNIDTIEYCPKHGAVDELLEACKVAKADIESCLDAFPEAQGCFASLRLLEKVIAKAEGRA